MLDIKLVKTSLLDASHWFVPVVIRSLTTLLPLLIVLTGLHEYFLVMEKYAVGNNQLMMAKMGQLLNGLMESGVLVLLLPLRYHEVAQNKSSRSWMNFAQTHFMPLFIESLRVFASVIFWGLLFIIPGIFRYIRLILVPFIVYFDPEYITGDVDALKRSNEFVKGAGIYIFVLLILSTGLYLMSHNWVGYAPSGTRILALFLVKAMNMAVSVFSFGILYSLYKQKSNFNIVSHEEGPNESNI